MVLVALSGCKKIIDFRIILSVYSNRILFGDFNEHWSRVMQKPFASLRAMQRFSLCMLCVTITLIIKPYTVQDEQTMHLFDPAPNAPKNLENLLKSYIFLENQVKRLRNIMIELHGSLSREETLNVVKRLHDIVLMVDSLYPTISLIALDVGIVRVQEFFKTNKSLDELKSLVWTFLIKTLSEISFRRHQVTKDFNMAFPKPC